MRINDYFDRVVVINLDRRTDRMAILDPRLKELGIEYERFSAIDAKAEGISGQDANRFSNLAILETVGTDKVLILEDDANFLPGFQEKFDIYIEHLPEDWDILYLGALLARTTGKTIPVNEYWHRQVVSTGTQAYCINPKKIDFFIEEIKKWDGYIDVGYRILADRTNAYIAQPNLVTQFPSYSDLREKEVDDF